MLITQPPQPAYDAAGDDAARRRRDLAVLDRLTELGMRIAERAAARALLEQETGDGTQAETRTETGTETRTETGTAGQPDAREAEVAFDRAARTVRTIIALKHRITTAQPARQPAPPVPVPVPWSPTQRLRRVLDWALRQAPDDPGLLDVRRQFQTRLAARLEGPEFVPHVAQDLRRRLFEAMPDHLVDRIGELDDENRDESEGDAAARPDQRGPDPP